MCPMVKLHHHPQLTKHPVVKSTKFTGAQILFFLAVILVIILGIFSIVYSFKKADTVESFSIYGYIKEKLGSVEVK
ncbi:MAG: hypothetical protein AAB657_04380 [Patescibacteria group bacterium]